MVTKGKTPSLRKLSKPPKNSKIHKVCMATIAMRAQGIKMKEIAEAVGYPVETVRTYLKYANKRGWLNIHSFVQPEDQIDVVLRSKTVRNVNEFLDARDKDVTIEIGKAFRMLGSPRVDVEQTPSVGVALKVEVMMPPVNGESPIQVRPGTVGGAPGFDIPVDAELIED